MLTVAEQPGLSFVGLLRQLRAEAGLTQEELAEAAGVSPRSVSNLERGINGTAHKDTAVLLAGALGLPGPGRRGGVRGGGDRALPRDTAAFTGRQAELAQLMATLTEAAAGGGVVGIHAIDGMAGIGHPTPGAGSTMV